MANLKTITIFGKKGKYGTRYTYTKDGLKWYDIHWNKTATNIPTQVGYLKITFDCSLCKPPKKGELITRKDGTQFQKNDIIYLDGKLTWEVDKEKESEYQEKQLSAIEDLFE